MTRVGPVGILLALACTLAGLASQPPPAAAAVSDVFASQWCSGGSVSVAFGWQGNDPSATQQWLDLSLFDNGFVEGTFLGAGPLDGSTNSLTWPGLLPGTLHYVRVNQQLPDSSWDPTGAFSFTTLACGQSDPQNATYTIEGRQVSLQNGIAEVPAAPGSASRVVTRYFGNEAVGDLNGDGVADAAFILTQSSGGSGTFFYVAAALQSDAGYRGTNAVLLGDRIAPQSTLIDNGEIIVNYAERRPDEPFTTRPSVGVTKRLAVVDGNLVTR